MHSVEAHQALSKVRGLTVSQRLLCTILCRCADANFECFLSETTLAEAMECNERTVRRLIRWLREKGVIDFAAANPGRRGHRYRLLFAINPDKHVRNNDGNNADKFNGAVTVPFATCELLSM